MTAIDTSSADVAPPYTSRMAADPALLAKPASAVSWAAIVAGAVTAAAVSLLLLALGSGLGLATAGPWVSHGASPVALTSAMLIWLIVMQWFASGMGGYITGRLRTRWHGVHTHEVFFRDTAHGLLAWALATLFVAILLGSALSDAAGAKLGGAAAPTPGAATASAFSYDSGYLFRSLRGDLPPSNAQARIDAEHILATGLARGGLSPDDSVYLNALVAAQTGVGPAEAQRRIDTVIDREQQIAAAAKQAADAARKTAASLAIFTSLAMLIGALIACVSAALGGMQRDEHL
jgi:hypothetical protein